MWGFFKCQGCSNERLKDIEEYIMEPTLKLKKAVADYKAGKREAFTELYEESKRYVYTCIYRTMSGDNNRQEAIQDVMQETYFEISRYITQLKDDDKFLLWAGTIAARKCIAYVKQNENYVLLDEDDTTFDGLADSDDIIPEEVMQNKEKQRLLMNIIDVKLTRIQKICVIAHYYNQMKQSEIAKELGIPENTVKTNLSRAKAKIHAGVIDLETKKDTKLYSVAPLLLFIFDEEVNACVVPQAITRGVMDTFLATMSKGTVAKGASLISLKLRLIMASVATVLAVAVGGGVYMAMQTDEETDESAGFSLEYHSDQRESSLVDIEETEETKNTVDNRLWDVLLNPIDNSDYYPYGNNSYRVWYNTHEISWGDINYMENVSELWFSTADINNDGVVEVLVGKCANESTFTAIINILQYDVKTGVVTDMDGNRVYEAYGDGQCLYDTGIMRTWENGEISYAYYWNWATGESWRCIDVSATESEEAYMQVIMDDETVVSGKEADELVRSLSSGNMVSLVWHKVTKENLSTYLVFD